ncbi:MAG: ABC transporter substrate-binding protein [Desulfurispora sp.]|uniref:ABC transporter substrate-binding protein n=1 Tax=Desulfurispora sp. TaxID=3014275 RepID=UPI00404A4E8C
MRYRLPALLMVLLSAALAVLSYYLFWWGKDREFAGYTLRVAVPPPNITSLPHLLMVPLGYASQEHLTISQMACPSSAAAWEKVQKKEADVALVHSLELLPVMETAAGLAQGGRPVFIAAIAASPAIYLVGAENTPGFAWTDLKDRSILTGTDTEQDSILLRYILQQNGLRPFASVLLYDSIPVQVRRAIVTTRLAHYAVLPAEEVYAQSEPGIYPLARLDSFTGRFPAATCVTTRQALQEKKAALQALVNALYRSQQWLQQNDPDQIRTALQREPAQPVPAFSPALLQEAHSGGWWYDRPLAAAGEWKMLEKILQASSEKVSLPDGLIFQDLARTALQQARLTPEKK